MLYHNNVSFAPAKFVFISRCTAQQKEPIMLKNQVLDKNIPVPLYFQLKNLISDQIKNGTYQSGDLIPTENELSEMFGISRTTVRQAISELVREGQLFRVKSKGTFVAKPKVTQHMLNRYFSYDREVSASGQKTERIQLGREVIPMPRQMVELGAGKPGDRVIYLKRKRLIENIPAVRIDAYLVFDKFKQLMDADLVHNSLLEIMNENPETRVYRQTRSVEAVPATKEDINELDVEPGSAIQKLTTVRYNEAGEVLELSVAYHRADMNRIEVEIINPMDELA